MTWVLMCDECPKSAVGGGVLLGAGKLTFDVLCGSKWSCWWVWGSSRHSRDFQDKTHDNPTT